MSLVSAGRITEDQGRVGREIGSSQAEIMDATWAVLGVSRHPIDKGRDARSVKDEDLRVGFAEKHAVGSDEELFDTVWLEEESSECVSDRSRHLRKRPLMQHLRDAEMVTSPVVSGERKVLLGPLDPERGTVELDFDVSFWRISSDDKGDGQLEV
jgi:hypothetical protein